MAAEAFDAFLKANEVNTTMEAFSSLLLVAELGSTPDQPFGLDLFDALRASVAPKLNFRHGKIFRNLQNRVEQGQTLKAGMTNMASERIRETLLPFRVLICGAGPVGLRAAVEAATLGFDVVVVEKRREFSRVNIITFWSETMADFCEHWSAQSFLHHRHGHGLCASGPIQHVGTREIQLVLLKNLLLLGGKVHYGKHVTGLCLSPSRPDDGNSHDRRRRWQGRVVPYVTTPRHDPNGSTTTPYEDDAEKATEFQKQKAYEQEWEKTGNKSKLLERCEVDSDFVNIDESPPPLDKKGEERLDLDAYLIAEGGWSNSTRKLGFDKIVWKREPVLGLVINLQYDKLNPTERDLQSNVFHCLNATTTHNQKSRWPLSECVVLAEFLEYLKGDTHFFAAVVQLENPDRAKTLRYLQQARDADHLTPDTRAQLEFVASRQGLLEMGVVREKLPRSELLRPDNVDAEALRRMARTIATECGLPPDTTPFCETNSVQIFDFSSLARCRVPMKLLRNDGTVLDVDDVDTMLGEDHDNTTLAGSGTALVLPIGDALQEPLWTSGLGVNRGFHGALNAVHAILCAREEGLTSARRSIQSSYQQMTVGIQWPSGLAGEGSKGCGVTHGKNWTCDPKSRFKTMQV